MIQRLMIVWMSLTFSQAVFAEPSESILATRVETQAEVAVGHTNFSAQPLSRLAIRVQNLAKGEGGSSMMSDGGGPMMVFSGNAATAVKVAKFLTQSATSTLTPLQGLGSAPNIAELAVNVGDSIQLLTLALENTGPSGGPFLTVSVKGAVQAWNSLVNALMDKMDSLYKESVPDAKEWQSIRNFLMDPKTHEMRGVLAGFAEKKSTP